MPFDLAYIQIIPQLLQLFCNHMQSPVSISLQRTIREVYEHLRANCTMFQKTDQKKNFPVERHNSKHLSQHNCQKLKNNKWF